MLYCRFDHKIAWLRNAGKVPLPKVVFIFALSILLWLWPATARADMVTDWNAIANTAVVTNAGRPPGAAHVDMAYVHIAIYDAVNAIDGRYSAFAVTPSSVPPGSSPEAAAAAAAHHVLRNFFPAQQGFLDAAYAASLAAITDGAAKTNGIAVGTEVAILFLALRIGDGRNASVTYTPGSGPGEWQPTPPAFAPPLAPWMAYMRPFALLDSSQFRAEGPPALDSAQWAADYNETKSFGALNSTSRTPEQTEIGRFYSEHVTAQYNRIFREFAASQGLSLADNARLFAMLYVASADALIAGWESKYYYRFWRPVTAIRAGDTDDNPATEANLTWTPLVLTPPHPEYPAAHGCFTGAVAQTLRAFFGTKRVTITLTSTVTGTARTFHNTDDLIHEIIDARIFGGMHYRTSGEHGTVIGKRVAKWVAKHYFRPIN